MMNKSIWVICDGPKFDSKHVLQLVNKASKLAKQLKTDISAISIGEYDEVAFKRLIQFGASNVVFCKNSIYDEAVYVDIISNMMREKKPGLLIFPATQFAKTLAASLSSKFEAGLTADCIDIEIDVDNSLIFSRAALNDSVIARIKCISSEFQMCTVKENVFTLPELMIERELSVEEFYYSYDQLFSFPLVDIVEKKLREKDNNINMASAKIVFAVGRGVKSQETIELIKKIAKKWKAEVVGTRAAVEEGLIEKSMQVGQSGISICPNVYFGFGISGASQHMVGIKNSKLIIAINSDENAPIFNYADYSIVDDLNSVLRELDSLIN